jgi:hypothetical protein
VPHNIGDETSENKFCTLVESGTNTLNANYELTHTHNPNALSVQLNLIKYLFWGLGKEVEIGRSPS